MEKFYAFNIKDPTPSLYLFRLLRNFKIIMMPKQLSNK